MGAVAGYNGNASFDIHAIDDSFNITAWKLDFTGEAPDKTDFTATGFRKFLSGLRQWSGSIELNVDDTSQLTIANIGSSGSLTLNYTDSIGFIGTAILTGVHPAVSVDGIQTQTVDFQGTGALALA